MAMSNHDGAQDSMRLDDVSDSCGTETDGLQEKRTRETSEAGAET